MPSTTLNQARVDFRISKEMKLLFEQAATLKGMTLSEFVKSVLVEKSQEVIQENEMHRLSERDREIFLSLLDNPPSPNPSLLAAAEEFKQAVKKGQLIP